MSKIKGIGKIGFGKEAILFRKNAEHGLKQTIKLLVNLDSSRFNRRKLLAGLHLASPLFRPVEMRDVD